MGLCISPIYGTCSVESLKAGSKYGCNGTFTKLPFHLIPSPTTFGTPLPSSPLVLCPVSIPESSAVFFTSPSLCPVSIVVNVSFFTLRSSCLVSISGEQR
ncbi:hypothetical protein Scep_014884 [Stephania cephalantha]|uniref:Uncharacterized protein n=1 Tax=Stephania cephalantha TaxID=152367 RepID=A0AAP0P0V0_9MAGN